LKKYKSPGSGQILAELIQAGGEILLSAIHKLVNSVWNKEEFPYQWKEFIILPVHKKVKKGDKTDCNDYRGLSLLSTSYNILSNILLSRLVPYIGESIGAQLLIRFSTFVRYCRKNGSTIRQYISYS
jgi:hypothetical protein